MAVHGVAYLGIINVSMLEILMRKTINTFVIPPATDETVSG